MAGFRCVAIACIASKAAALRPLLTQRAPQGHSQRSRSIVAQYQVQDLPAGWITGTDPASGATYYCHDATGECQWELPLQPGDQPMSETAAHNLPAGWTTVIDQASGATYYYHESTGASQWEPPPRQQSALEAAGLGQLEAVLNASPLREVLNASDGDGPGVVVLAGGAALVAILGLALASLIGMGSADKGSAKLGPSASSSQQVRSAASKPRAAPQGGLAGLEREIGGFEEDWESKQARALELGRLEKREREMMREERKEEKQLEKGMTEAEKEVARKKEKEWEKIVRSEERREEKEVRRGY